MPESTMDIICRCLRQNYTQIFGRTPAHQLNQIALEIDSDLNRKGTQSDCHSDNPTLSQLVGHYIKTGGFMRHLRRKGLAL